MLDSPMRHHRRTPSIGRQPVKETLDACLVYDSDEDGGQGTRINQYTLQKEIGRGSFGAVHLAFDQSGKEYAIKEFSKSRLRKRSQTQILRRPQVGNRRGGFLNPQMHRRSASEIYREKEAGNPLYLILEEIAILKKLYHENIVRLYEVLDDPEGDSLYMVLEMCEKGVIMKVGINEKTDPYPEDQCCLWFRDMMLGIEYLHAQGIIHRDIKPDNLLLTADNVLKFVDFGVSEMFQKKGPMKTSKTAGSPAFLPPELCKGGHGEVDGCAADVWSMGVTLYCLYYGSLPFNHNGIIELYKSIQNDDIVITPETNPDLADLFRGLLEKDPAKRIKISQLREHPWVTRNGRDKLVSREENIAEFIESPTEEEMESAITNRMGHIMTIVRAVRKLKQRLKSHGTKTGESIKEESKAETPLSQTDSASPSSDSTSLTEPERALPTLVRTNTDPSGIVSLGSTTPSRLPTIELEGCRLSTSNDKPAPAANDLSRVPRSMAIDTDVIVAIPEICESHVTEEGNTNKGRFATRKTQT